MGLLIFWRASRSFADKFPFFQRICLSFPLIFLTFPFPNCSFSLFRLALFSCIYSHWATNSIMCVLVNIPQTMTLQTSAFKRMLRSGFGRRAGREGRPAGCSRRGVCLIEKDAMRSPAAKGLNFVLCLDWNFIIDYLGRGRREEFFTCKLRQNEDQNEGMDGLSTHRRKYFNKY